MSLNYKKLINGIIDKQLQPGEFHNEKWIKLPGYKNEFDELNKSIDH
jgi:hypothetical protein